MATQFNGLTLLFHTGQVYEQQDGLQLFEQSGVRDHDQFLHAGSAVQPRNERSDAHPEHSQLPFALAGHLNHWRLRPDVPPGSPGLRTDREIPREL